MPSSVFTIGEAAARAGVSADTIRYYERQGVLPPAERTDAGYRLYSLEAVERIRVVRNAVRFGFAVKEVAAFLTACRAGRPPCHTVRNEGGRLLAEMDRRISEMIASREAMQTTLERWDRQLAATSEGGRALLLHALPAAEAPSGRRRSRGSV